MIMFYSFSLAIIYFFILFFFGWQLVQYLLKENRIEHLIGLSGIFGVGLYIFLINAIGHFISIKIVFYLVLLLFFILGLGLLYFNRAKSLEWGIDRKWRKILLGAFLLLVISSGIISFRWPLDLQGAGTQTAATIVEGNFPPVEIWNPPNPLNYHYAPELFSAAIHQVTGLPLYLAYDFQAAMLVGILFLLGFILIKRFCHDNFKAFISSLLMIYAGSLIFLKGIAGMPILYNLYVLHQEMFAPFKFVGDAISSEFSIPALRNMLTVPWTPLAFPLIMVIIYLYFYLVDQKANKIIFPLGGLLLALLALVAETYFVVLSLILLIYPFAFGFLKKDWQKARSSLLVSFLILLVALPLAFLQGGVLTGVLAKLSSGEYYIAPGFNIDAGGLFKIHKTPWLLSYNQQPIYDPKFLFEWGLLFILLIPGFIFLFKRHFQFGLFLAISLIAFFSVPFIITFNNPVSDGQLPRLFYPVNLLGGLVAGLLLGSWYLSVKKTWLKGGILFITIILMAQTLLFQLLFLSIGYPPGTWNGADKIYVKPDSFEGRVYQWVKTNTSIDDYFLIIKKDSEYAGSSVTPNHEFVLNTGRLAPIYAYTWPDYQAGNLLVSSDPNLFKEVRENCDSAVIKSLQYSYLYVNEKWMEGMEEKCLANNDLELKFEAGEGNKFVRIYKVFWEK